MSPETVASRLESILSDLRAPGEVTPLLHGEHIGVYEFEPEDASRSGRKGRIIALANYIADELGAVRVSVIAASERSVVRLVVEHSMEEAYMYGSRAGHIYSPAYVGRRTGNLRLVQNSGGGL